MATPKQTTYGGHDHEFVDKVRDQLICSICTKVLRDPHLTGCCGQHFCESCLTHWFKRHKTKTCPYCREENLAHLLNKALQRDISQLKVYCTHRGEGCKWEGEMGDLQTHLDSNKGCGYVEVECPNKCATSKREEHNIISFENVRTKVKRKDIDEHLNNECYLRRYKCEHCNLGDTYYAITGSRPVVAGFYMFKPSHYSKCPLFPLDCPNKCGAMGIRRKDMPSHRQQCLLEMLACPNQCEVHVLFGYMVRCKFNRKDLPEHLRAKCYLRSYSCEYCGHKDTYQAITGEGGPIKPTKFHYTSCPDYPLVCPNTCGAEAIKRKDMPSHREQCPLEPVQCPFQEAGCETALVRRDLENHMATQMQQHLMLTFQELKKQNNELQLKCASLEKELQTVKAALK